MRKITCELFIQIFIIIVVGLILYITINLEPDSRTRAMFDLRGKCHAMGGEAKLDSETQTVICYRQYIDQNKLELFREQYH